MLLLLSLLFFIAVVPAVTFAAVFVVVGAVAVGCCAFDVML